MTLQLPVILIAEALSNVLTPHIPNTVFKNFIYIIKKKKSLKGLDPEFTEEISRDYFSLLSGPTRVEGKTDSTVMPGDGRGILLLTSLFPRTVLTR